MLERLTATVVLALVLGGCASTYRWQKADATPETQARDEAACRVESRDLSSEYAYGAYGPGGVPGPLSPWRRPGMGAYPDPAWQAAAEQRVYARCMQNRGYELVREDKKP